ncbi:MAG: N-6 DNA methylase [Sphaerochaeta sp.]|nr:N-6 DNA methylase [Sphaerochaeta sp.]
MESWRMAKILEQRFPGWDSRRYIIAMLLYRYLSQEMEQFAEGQPELLLSQKRYRTMDDEEAENLAGKAGSTIGFFIPPSDLFCNVHRDAARDGNLGKTLEWVFSDMEESAIGYASESVLRNLSRHLDIDGTELGLVPKERKKKLYSLMKAVSGIREEAISDMASSFESLLVQYSRPMATKEESFEARFVHDLLILLVCRGKKSLQSLYDPYCGTGVLLSHARFRLAEDGCLYGQSETISEYNMARSFMFLIHLDPIRLSLAYGDSLTSFESFGGRSFEAIASILPAKKRWIGEEDASLAADPRFSPAGVLAPKTKTDLAYVMHAVYCLSEGGTAAFALGEGALSRERSERDIRKWLLANNLVDAVLRIPSEGLHSHAMHRHMLVVRKGRRDTKILFINASSQPRNKRLSFALVGELSHMYNERREVPNYSCLMDREEVLANGCDLRPFQYVGRSHRGEGKSGTSPAKTLGEISGKLALLSVSPTALASLVKKLEMAPLLPVGTLADIKVGKNAGLHAFTDAPEGLGYVRTSDLAGNFSDSIFINPSVLKISPQAATAKVFDKHTILFPKHATSIRSGKCGILSKRSAVEGNLLCLVPQKGVMEEYLLHAFGAWAKEVWLKRTDRKEVLRRSDTVDAMIRFPSTAVQKQVRETIRSLQTSERLLQEKTSLLRERLAKRLEEIMASILDEPRVPVSAVAQVSKIPGYKYNKFVRYDPSGRCIALRGCNVKNGRLVHANAQRLDDAILHEISCALLHKGDILFTFVGSPGHTAVIDRDDYYYLEPDVALIRVDETRVLPEYLYYWYQNSPACRLRFTSEERSVGRRSISFDRIRSFKVSLPPLQRQREIVEELETGCMARIIESEAALSAVRANLDMLASKLAL